MTDAQFAAWLKNSASIRCVLVEVNVSVGGVEQTRYLSTKGYVSGPTDTPANTHYAPGIVGGVKFTETLPLDGTASLAYGDIEIENVSGNRDSWFDDVWDNRSIKVFIGDVQWVRSDFRQIFEGIVAGIDTKDRGRINLKISDKIQRLNTPVTENKLGGTTANADRLIPLCFGECHNITPLLVDATVNEYQVHDGPIESIIEVRDNGVPVAFTPFLATGKFRLTKQPENGGQITASVQGSKPPEVLGSEMNSEYTCDTLATWSESTAGSSTIVSGTYNLAATTATQVRLAKRFPTIPGVKYRVSVDIVQVSGATCGVHCNLAGGIVALASQGPTVGTKTAGTTGTVTVDVQAIGFETTVILYTAGTGAFARYDNISFRRVDGGSYINTIPSIIRQIVTQRGRPADRLTYDELSDDFNLLDATYPQPVGVYLDERTNMIQAVSDLAGSIGAKPLFNRSGKFTIVRLAFANDSPSTPLLWNMDGPNQYLSTGWVQVTGSYTYSGGKGTLTSTITTAIISMATSFPGAVYTRVRAKVKRLAGSTWVGNCFYSTDAHVVSASFLKNVPNQLAIGEEKILEWDMSDIPDWSSSMIRTVRLDMGQTLGDQFEIDWISIEPAGASVGPTDILQGSLSVSQLPPVKAGAKIGYCKNWTVENTIAAGVDQRHVDLYKQEWLTITQTDSATQAAYKTFAEPDQQDTLLLTGADALAEAQRRLNLFNRQRKVFKYTGMPWLMMEKLGSFQTFTNSRFGLQTGVVGQIVSTSVDWLNAHITVEIFV